MNKKYLIEAEKCKVGGFTKLSFEPTDAKEAKTLSDFDSSMTIDLYLLNSKYANFSDYLKANNLLIVKIKE